MTIRAICYVYMLRYDRGFSYFRKITQPNVKIQILSVQKRFISREGKPESQVSKANLLLVRICSCPMYVSQHYLHYVNFEYRNRSIFMCLMLLARQSSDTVEFLVFQMKI